MNTIQTWARKWGIPDEAVCDLIESLQSRVNIGCGGYTAEGDVLNSVRLEGARSGVPLWRNNSGAFQDASGRVIRFGLGNDSKRVCDEFKSADLIGIRPVTIQPYHVGKVIGQFVAREIKRFGWMFTGTKREVGQLNFLTFVLLRGGDAAFTDRIGSI